MSFPTALPAPGDGCAGPVDGGWTLEDSEPLVEVSIAIHAGPAAMHRARALADWLSSIAAEAGYETRTGRSRAHAGTAPIRTGGVGAWTGVAGTLTSVDGRRLDPGSTPPELILSPDRRTASLDGLAIALTRREFDLLVFLARHPHQVFSRTQLLERVWLCDTGCGERTIDVHVRRLRQKLAGRGPAITTIRGVGYRLDGPDRLGLRHG
ncbi:hypothetical protein GCM10023322_74740 [Rugosimonospora acidiphila]|uniref:OmpR/PhoB-type domain-containing protein n=1 Tax=Rugosimonospora acidiphila TaxID=556531 RepID=A0ABP9SPX9_9ACTN